MLAGFFGNTAAVLRKETASSRCFSSASVVLSLVTTCTPAFNAVIHLSKCPSCQQLVRPVLDSSSHWSNARKKKVDNRCSKMLGIVVGRMLESSTVGVSNMEYSKCSKVLGFVVGRMLECSNHPTLVCQSTRFVNISCAIIKYDTYQHLVRHFVQTPCVLKREKIPVPFGLELNIVTTLYELCI